MSAKDLLEASLITQCVMDSTVLAVMKVRRTTGIFPQLGWLLAVNALSAFTSVALLWFWPELHLSPAQAYFAYFVSAWALSAFMLVMRVLAVYGVFAEAMRPLSGLHQAGKIIFRWATVVSLVVSLAMLAGPGAFSSVQALTDVFSRLQQGVSVLTLCLLIFVCFAIRPLGLTFRSHLFGVSLGLGVAASVELIQAAWQMTSGAHSLYSPIYLFGSLGSCAAIAIWGVYFAMPEPARKMILLPTTSPFFFWNRISEILGDSPGHVAIAGFTPDMLAPAEIEMLTAATASERAMDALGEDSPHPFPERPTLPDLVGAVRPSLA